MLAFYLIMILILALMTIIAQEQLKANSDVSDEF